MRSSVQAKGYTRQQTRRQCDAEQQAGLESTDVPRPTGAITICMMDDAIARTSTGMCWPSSSRTNKGVITTPAAVDRAVSTMLRAACSGCTRKVA